MLRRTPITSIPNLTEREILDWMHWIEKEQWDLIDDNTWHRPYVVNDMEISDAVLYELYLRDKNKNQ